MTELSLDYDWICPNYRWISEAEKLISFRRADFYVQNFSDDLECFQTTLKVSGQFENISDNLITFLESFHTFWKVYRKLVNFIDNWKLSRQSGKFTDNHDTFRKS